MDEILKVLLKGLGFSAATIILIIIFGRKVSNTVIDIILKRIDIKLDEESSKRLKMFSSEIDQINNEKSLIMNNVLLRTNGAVSERLIKAAEDYWVLLIQITQRFGQLVTFYKRFSDEDLIRYYEIDNISDYADAIKKDLDAFIESNEFVDQTIDRQAIFLSDSLIEKYFIFVIFMTQASMQIALNIKTIPSPDLKPIIWHENYEILPSLFKFFNDKEVVYGMIDKNSHSFDAIFYQMRDVIQSELTDLIHGKNQLVDSLKTVSDAYSKYEEIEKLRKISHSPL